MGEKQDGCLALGYIIWAQVARAQGLAAQSCNLAGSEEVYLGEATLLEVYLGDWADPEQGADVS